MCTEFWLAARSIILQYIPDSRCVDRGSKQIVMWLPVLSLVKNTKQTSMNDLTSELCFYLMRGQVTTWRFVYFHYQDILNCTKLVKWLTYIRNIKISSLFLRFFLFPQKILSKNTPHPKFLFHSFLLNSDTADWTYANPTAVRLLQIPTTIVKREKINKKRP